MLLSKDFHPSVTALSNNTYKAFFDYAGVPRFETINSSSRAAITEIRVKLEEWFMKMKEMGLELPQA